MWIILTWLKSQTVSLVMFQMILVLGVLWCGAFLTWMWFLTRGRIYPVTWTDCKLSRFVFRTGRYYSSWLLVIISIEKCFILYFPLKAKSICTVRMAKQVCFIAACIFIVHGIQWFFILKASKNKNGLPTCTYINVLHDYIKTYAYTDAALYSFGPFSLMIISNCLIIYKF